MHFPEQLIVLESTINFEFEILSQHLEQFWEIKVLSLELQVRRGG